MCARVHNQGRLPSVALRAFSAYGFVASFQLEWLIGVEVSVANRSRSSQARRDSSRMNRIPPRGWAGGSERNQVSLSGER
jgi:hypothetical protein